LKTFTINKKNEVVELKEPHDITVEGKLVDTIQVPVEFLDISNEAWRTYIFKGGEEVTITAPVKLNVKRKPEGDSHRLIDAAGRSWYIPAGWFAIVWEGKNGPAYSF
jgi:hypothetical protein